MLALIERTRERLEQEDARTRRLNERYADEPMIGEPVWHPHNVNGGQ
jgi:hypothetical protein